MRAPPRQLEHTEQVDLFARIDRATATYPDLALAFAVPNGAVRPGRTIIGGDGRAWRLSLVGQKLKAEGVRPGVPDVWLPAPRGPYPGLVIEMKAEKGSLDPKQREWLHRLAAAGWCVRVCYGADEAWRELLAYLHLSTARPPRLPQFVPVTVEEAQQHLTAKRAPDKLSDALLTTARLASRAGFGRFGHVLARLVWALTGGPV